MSTVTLPPVEVDSTYFARQSKGEINPFMGKFGSTLYQVLVKSEVSPYISNPELAIYRSTDGGNNWTEQNQPNVPAILTTFARCTVFFDIVAGLIHILFTGPGVGPQIVVFDTAPNTYGAPNAEGSNTIQPGTLNFFYQKTNGDYVFIRAGFGGGGNNIDYVTNIANSWSGHTNVLTGSNFPGVWGGVRDGADAAHLTYRTGAGQALMYARLDDSFSVSTPVTLLASGFQPYRTSCVLYGADSVAIGYSDQQTVYVSIGTPLSNPSFTQYTLDTVTGSAGVSYVTLAIDKDGNLVAFWAVVDYGVSPIIDKLMMSTFNGTSWSVPVVFYDELANFPPDSSTQTLQFIHTGDAVQFPNGDWVFATALETGPAGADDFCTGFALLSRATAARRVLLPRYIPGEIQA